MPDVDVEADARVVVLQVLQVLDAAVAVERQRRQIQLAAYVHRLPAARLPAICHILQIISPSRSVIFLVDLQAPRDEAAAQALVVVVLDAQQALLGGEVWRQRVLGTAMHRSNVRQECRQVVHRHVGELQAFDANPNPATG